MSAKLKSNVDHRNYQPVTHQEIAEHLKISKTRVQQIKRRALLKMQKQIEADAAARGLEPREWLMEA